MHQQTVGCACSEHRILWAGVVRAGMLPAVAVKPLFTQYPYMRFNDTAEMARISLPLMHPDNLPNRIAFISLTCFVHEHDFLPSPTWACKRQNKRIQNLPVPLLCFNETQPNFIAECQVRFAPLSGSRNQSSRVEKMELGSAQG
jgi:hypothetical protein